LTWVPHVRPARANVGPFGFHPPARSRIAHHSSFALPAFPSSVPHFPFLILASINGAPSVQDGAPEAMVNGARGISQGSLGDKTANGGLREFRPSLVRPFPSSSSRAFDRERSTRGFHSGWRKRRAQGTMLPMLEKNLRKPFKKTGALWRRSSPVRTRAVRSVCEALTRVYGNPRFGNPSNPLDDLVYIIVSNKTTPRTARATYRRLRRRFKKWDEVLGAPLSALRFLLKPAGLSVVKSRHIRAALRSIKDDFGACNLKSIKQLDLEAAQTYLVGLPGVSEKVAKCVMMYTLNLPVLPVDTHVHRVSLRLGWTARRRADQCHAELEALVPPTLRQGFHVSCIAHGRKVCRPRNPLCHHCCVNRYCEFYKAAR
jgi:endonuclease-3